LTPLTDLIVRNEDRLLGHVLSLAEANGYFRFVPETPEAWRDTLRGLSGSLLQALRSDPSPPSLTADDVGRDDGLCAFGVVLARKHRREGMPLGIFLGLVKFFRQAYLDLVRSAGLPREEEEGHLRYVERFFDRNEVAVCVSWTSESVSGVVAELREENDEITRKNLRLNETLAALKGAQAKVLHQEKMASIGLLAAGVAHEISNPIGFIHSNLSTLGKYLSRIVRFLAVQSGCIAAGAPPEQVGFVRQEQAGLKIDYIVKDLEDLVRESLEGAERVQSIVADLKSFSRVDESDYRPADLNESLRSTINIAWNEIRHKATLQKELGEIPRTRCYPQQMSQVFMNLLVNAAHAIEGRGVITVRSWKEGGYVCVSVADTGRGIPEENLNRIFEPFFTTKEAGRGTGLGLSIACDIVKKHNGEIAVRSEAGKGTVFTVRIPVVVEV
jgi:signal transduction histidine kinase